jgi:hypothetical protein
MVLIMAEVVRAMPRVWREVRAEGRTKRLAKHRHRPDESPLELPINDIPPSSDI